MLNKKAIAAFAAGATLLAGMAFAAPVVATAPAFAETATTKTHAKDVQKKIDEVNKKIEEANKTLKAAEKAADDAFTKEASAIVSKEGKLTDTTNYEQNQGGTVTKKAGTQGTDAGAKAANAYLEKLSAAKTAQDAKNKLVLEKSALEEQLNDTVEAKVAAYKKSLDESAKKLAELKKKVDAAFPQYAKDTNAQKKAEQALTCANADLTAFVTKTPADQKASKEYKAEYKRLKNLVKEATIAEQNAANALVKSAAAFNKAKGAYNDELKGYTKSYNDLNAADKVAAADYATPEFLALDTEVTYNTDYFDESAPSEKGKGGHKSDHKQNKQNSKDKGKNGVHINTKGRKGKKQLGKTGVGVAFAALAAAMLAGMGAAVRKIRH